MIANHGGIAALVVLLSSRTRGTPETAAVALGRLARDDGILNKAGEKEAINQEEVINHKEVINQRASSKGGGVPSERSEAGCEVETWRAVANALGLVA